MIQLAVDTTRISVNQFKNQVFLWEIIFTLIVFIGVFWILRTYYKKNEKSKKENKDYFRLD